MYEGVNNEKMEREIKHIELIFKCMRVSTKKKNLEKAYTTEQADVNKCINAQQRGC
jgi:hypothetical protein